MSMDAPLHRSGMSSLINLTVEACTPSDALPTLVAFVSYLHKFGLASHNDTAHVYYKFPNTIKAQIEFYPCEPLRQTMEEMIESLKVPESFASKKRSFSWDERNSQSRIPEYPKITWMNIQFPHALFEREYQGARDENKAIAETPEGDQINSDDNELAPIDDSCSIINLAVEASTPAEALPSLDYFVRHLATYGRVFHNDSAKIYENVPKTIVASLLFYPNEPLKDMMDAMIASLQIPEVAPQALPSFTWDERNTKLRMRAFPQITWLSLLYPNAVCKHGDAEICDGPIVADRLFAMMYLTVEASSASEALPTLAALVNHLQQFGEASYDGRARVCETARDMMIAEIVFYPRQPLRRSMERMIASFQFPGGTCQERAAFSWSERNTKKRMSAFPQITWLYIELPYIVYEG